MPTAKNRHPESFWRKMKSLQRNKTFTKNNELSVIEFREPYHPSQTSIFLIIVDKYMYDVTF